MEYFKKLAVLSLFCASVNLAYATSKPTQCPSVAAIQAVGVDSTGFIDWTWEAATSEDHPYDTDHSWFFSINHECSLFDSCKEPTNLLAKANAALTSLKFVEGPIQEGNSWACHYSVNDDYFNKIYARAW